MIGNCLRSDCTHSIKFLLLGIHKQHIWIKNIPKPRGFSPITWTSCQSRGPLDPTWPLWDCSLNSNCHDLFSLFMLSFFACASCFKYPWVSFFSFLMTVSLHFPVNTYQSRYVLHSFHIINLARKYHRWKVFHFLSFCSSQAKFTLYHTSVWNWNYTELPCYISFLMTVTGYKSFLLGWHMNYRGCFR